MKGKKILIGAGIGVGTVSILYLLLRKKQPPLITQSLKNANQLGLDLGTAYPWIDPRHYTENDQDAEDLLQSIPDSQIPQLVKDYQILFSRDLVSDLQKYLSGWDYVKDKFMVSNSSPVSKMNSFLYPSKSVLLKIKKRIPVKGSSPY